MNYGFMFLFIAQVVIIIPLMMGWLGYDTKNSLFDRLVVVMLWTSLALESLAKI